MSARRLLALLVVVALGLLIVCPTAFSRPELPRYHEGVWDDPSNPDDDPDPDDPNGFVDGDDDNWDKSGGKGHTLADCCIGCDSPGRGAGSKSTEIVVSRMGIGFGVRLALFLQSWVVLHSLR